MADPREEELLNHMQKLALVMRERAFKYPVYDGKISTRGTMLLAALREVDPVTNTTIIFSRDSGMHNVGWWKNPEYNSCLHLSVSAAPPIIYMPGVAKAELDKKTSFRWVKAFFGEHSKWVWHEGPYSRNGKRYSVHHYRLFCDAKNNWEPLLPKGEVYSKLNTELGWKSFSEIHGDGDLNFGQEISK